MNNNIKKYRAQTGLTQEELANKTGVTRQTINAVEKNKYIPSLKLALKIAHIFKVKIEDIFDYKN